MYVNRLFSNLIFWSRNPGNPLKVVLRPTLTNPAVLVRLQFGIFSLVEFGDEVYPSHVYW